MMKTATISSEEYQLVLQALPIMATMVAGMKLDEFLEKISVATEAGPALLPQLYAIPGVMASLEATKAMAEGLRAFQRSLPPAMRRPLHLAPVGQWAPPEEKPLQGIKASTIVADDHPPKSGVNDGCWNPGCETPGCAPTADEDLP